MTVLWVLAAFGVIPAAIAVRAYLTERREGMARSTLRAIVAPLISIALVAVAWPGERGEPVRGAPPAPPPSRAVPQAASPTSPALPAQPASPPPGLGADHDPVSARLWRELNELVAKRDALTAEITTKQAELDARVQHRPVAPRPVPDDPGPGAASSDTSRAMLVYIDLALLFAGLCVLLFGDRSTLLPRRRKAIVAAADGVEPADVARLAEHARAGKWTAGLGTAARIAIEQLSKLEVLDFLFLRALCNTMLVCAPDGDAARVSRDASADKLAAAGDDLVRLLELAPHMAEALWLHGYVRALTGEWQPGLERFRQARAGLDDLAFDHNESVCLLHLAEGRMANADNEGATQLFDEVVKLDVLAAHVPMVMVTHRILRVRADIKANRLAQAAEGIAQIRKVEGLDDATRRSVTTACDVYELAVCRRSGKLAEALTATVAQLARMEPAKLPAIEDQIADEFLHPAIERSELRLPAELYRALYFFEAVLRVELAAQRGRPLDPETVDAIAVALLRALQFEPRQRDALAALAALYLAYRKDRTDRALEWLDAAIVLGVRSRQARTLLIETRRIENQRNEVLALFRTASARFLSDPALGLQVRNALIEELGRFDEFRPVMLDLHDTGVLGLPSADEVTISGLHERAAFVANVASEIAQHMNSHGGTAGTLHELHRELGALAANVDSSARRIGAIERSIMEQLGQLVLR